MIQEENEFDLAYFSQLGCTYRAEIPIGKKLPLGNAKNYRITEPNATPNDKNRNMLFTCQLYIFNIQITSIIIY